LISFGFNTVEKLQTMAFRAPKAITSTGEPTTARYLLKMFIVCLSYVNLCFLNVWVEMDSRRTDALRIYGDTWPKLAAVTLDILILAVFIWGVLYLALWTGKSLWVRLLKWVAIIGLLLPINIIRLHESLFSSDPVPTLNAGERMAVLLVVAVAALLLLVNWERIGTRVTTTLLVILAPSMPLSVGAAARHIWMGPPHGLYPNKPLQRALPESPGAPHLLWILFDEWDQALTFPERPAGLSLPELDRFQSQSFRANRAYSPSRATLISVPSLLTGKIFVQARSTSWNEVMMEYNPGEASVALSKQETIFSVARGCGFNVGIVGWYLPYCRLIPECTVCSWYPAMGPLARGEYEKPYPVPSMMAQILKRQVKVVPLFKRLGIDDVDAGETPMARALHGISYGEIHEALLQAITDPRLNLTFVHVSVPHLPGIYDPSKDAISDDRNNTYLGNLRLVDRTVGDIRKALEKAGMWDTSTILLTGDHPLRTYKGAYQERHPSQRGLTQHSQVPYLLRMPGESQGVVYDTPINTIVTKDLLIAILNRQVATPRQIATWLDRHPPHL
jgi:hypothetical protein